MNKIAEKVIGSAGAAVRALNPSVFKPQGKPLCEVFAAEGKRIRQDTKPLLNKLETEWFSILQDSGWLEHLKPQAKRYKLGNGIWYKPDFVGKDTRDGRETAYEVKGPHAFRGGFENLKVAAAIYLDVKWILVWKEKDGWHQQKVEP
jgi:hypothetical protein